LRRFFRRLGRSVGLFALDGGCGGYPTLFEWSSVQWEVMWASVLTPMILVNGDDL